VARRLEEFREALTKLLPRARFSRTPTVVLVFPNDRAYRPFAPTYNGKTVEASGFFQPGDDANYVTIVLNTHYDPYPIVFHEFAHLFLETNVRNVPLWFNEGFAEFYSSFEVSKDGKQARVGRVVDRHLQLLNSRWVPLGQVLGATHLSPIYNISDDRNTFYSESWLLVHYLMLGPQARTDKMLDFLGLFQQNVPGDQACRQAFGVSVSALDNGLRDYARQRLTYTMKVVTFAEPISARTRAPVQPVPEAAAEARLGDLLLHMDRKEEADARLQNALRLDPDLLMGHLALGELRLRQQKEAEGLKLLERATTLKSSGPEAHIAYGRAILRRAGAAPTDEQIDRARAAFARAAEISPDSPEALAGIAWVDLLSGARLDEARRFAERASELDPTELDHVLLLAQIMGRQGDFKGARDRLGPLMAAGVPAVRERATSLMSTLAEYEKRLAAHPGREPVSIGGGKIIYIRAPKEGERRTFGTLESIECTPVGIIFHVRSGDAASRFTAAKFSSVEFVSYRDDLAGNIGCGERKPAESVYVTWRPVPGADGAAVAVEAMPKDWVPKEK
jgi:tetratricopeptide (TPR) repeat protein